MKDLINTIAASVGSGVTILIYVAILVGTPLGIWHAFESQGTKHGLISVFIPPYAWYESVDYLLHGNYPDINWDQRLPHDTKVITGLLYAACTSDPQIMQDHVNPRIERESAEIKKYPDEKQRYLQTMGRLYLQYMASTLGDMKKNLKQAAVTGVPPKFSPSARTNDLTARLRHYAGISPALNLNRKLLAGLGDKLTPPAGRSVSQDELRNLYEAASAQLYGETYFMQARGSEAYKDIFGIPYHVSLEK